MAITRYEAKTVETMKEIRFLQDIGLSLKEIKIFKESDNDNRRKLLIEYRARFKEKIDDSIKALNRLDEIIEELSIDKINEHLFYLF